MTNSSSHGRLAAEAWKYMFDFLMRSSPRRAQGLAKRGLTPNDSRALFSLDKETGRPIGELARLWACDPSNATWIVDRLERSGLAKRVASPEDRRIKLVKLTPKGDRTRENLMAEFHEPPEALLQLSVADLKALKRIVSRLQR